MGFEVFIDKSLNQGEIGDLEDQIEAISGAQEVNFISKDEALQRFREEFGEDPLAILGENPLPSSFQVIPDVTHRAPDKLEALTRSIESIHGVDEVVYRGQLVRLIDRYSRYILVIDAVLLVVVFLAAIFLVSNTLRLTILAQGDKIEIMKLVGATRKFIRRPYIVQGMIQGGFAGLLGTLIVWIAGWLVSLRFPQLLQLPTLLVMAPLFFGIVLGVSGSRVGISRFLRT